MCDLLKTPDNKCASHASTGADSSRVQQVALDGLENILKVGELDKDQHGGMNMYSQYVEEAGGMVRRRVHARALTS